MICCKTGQVEQLPLVELFSLVSRPGQLYWPTGRKNSKWSLLFWQPLNLVTKQPFPLNYSLHTGAGGGLRARARAGCSCTALYERSVSSCRVYKAYT